jgi:hypothetical protein
MWGWGGSGRWVPAEPAYPPEGTVEGEARTWREVEGLGEVEGLRWLAEAEGQIPPCAIHSEGHCCRTETKRGRGFRGPSLRDPQLVTGIGWWSMLGRLGVTWARLSCPPLPQGGHSQSRCWGEARGSCTRRLG